MKAKLLILLVPALLLILLLVAPGVITPTDRQMQKQVTAEPILIITSALNPFTSYYTEILRTEGLNEFVTCDISHLTPRVLSSCTVAILGEMPVDAGQVKMLSAWLDSGGNLIVMRPDKKLSSLFGLKPATSTLADGYLRIDTTSGPGSGLVGETMQFHGTADLYTSSGASVLAVLYSDAKSATPYPAVTMSHTQNGKGTAVAFTYDLARSVVYTRQGNPEWSGKERSGVSPIRSVDLFFGASRSNPEPDWVDPDKIAIPQADEQQRLLANIIIRMSFPRVPLPRFWYLPRGLPAAVVMTGDDHGSGGTAGRFDSYLAQSKSGCSVDDWECIRSTSYIFPSTPISDEEARAYDEAGFEVALHVSTNCSDWTPSSLGVLFGNQMESWKQKYPSVPSPVTNRTHCIAWSDFVTQPVVELKNGIRFDTNYYYWPPAWVSNRPGYFTGSAMPMRFAALDGTVIDVYQAVTQMTDESGQSYPFTINTLLDGASRKGFYGVFTVNAHTDEVESTVSDAVITSATVRGIPVVSARQMLKWLDGRNGSSFSTIVAKGDTLSFSINADPGAQGLTAMAPILEGKIVTQVEREGRRVPFSEATIKGVRYVRFPATDGSYVVRYRGSQKTKSKAG